MDGYSSEVEQQMGRFYRSLNERDRRRYAGIEAAKLGHGAIEYVSRSSDVNIAVQVSSACGAFNWTFAKR